MLDREDNSDNYSDNGELSLIAEKSSFLDNLIMGKNGKPKITLSVTNKTQNNFLALLELIINSLTSSKKNDTEAEVKIQNLDSTQVWALIDNFSKEALKSVKIFNEKISKPVIEELKGAKRSLSFLSKKQKREEDEKEELEETGDLEPIEEKERDDFENEDDDNFAEEEPQQENKKLGSKKQKYKKDMFFDLSEMNKFADDLEEDVAKDQDEMNDSQDEELDDDIREGGELGQENEDNKQFKYEDFFDAPEDSKGKYKSKKPTVEDEKERDDDYMEDDIFDIENKIIKDKKEDVDKNYEFVNKDVEDTIEEIEQKMMANKQWHMKGEVTSRERPKGSLLENFLDFEATVRPPPIPTGEYTDNIEKLIKLRIKDDLFDDPVRNTVEIKDKKPQFELNFQKDKKGLAEIYEEDYEKNVLKLSSETEISHAKKEIDDLCAKVYTIFDKLTNNNFISGSRHNEMKVITNVPSIQLEEISNYVTDNKSNAKSSAEMFNSKDAVFKTRDELSTVERKTAHKNWKRNVRNRLRESATNKKMKNLMKTADSKFEAKMIMKQEKDKKAIKNSMNSELKSSKFFGNLQKIASEDINRKKRKDQGVVDFNQIGGESKSAKNFKL